MQTATNPPSFTPVVYQHWSGDRQAQYRIFEPSETGNSARMCVFGDRITEASYSDDVTIIQAIWEKEQFDIADMAFFQLQSQLSTPRVPSGFYRFNQLTVKPAETACTRYAVFVTGWENVVCPYHVYQAFKEQIGDFWTLEEYISRDNPVIGSAYRGQNFTDEQMAAELEWARGWIQSLKALGEKSAQKHRKIILTPEEAQRRGYRFDPNIHQECLPNDDKIAEWLSGGVFVDLSNSHLRGQCTDGYDAAHQLGQPKRFSFWARLNS